MYSVIWFYHSYTIQNIIIYAIHCEQHVAFVCENNNFSPSFSTFFKNLILHKNLCCCLSFHICMEYSSLKNQHLFTQWAKKSRQKTCEINWISLISRTFCFQKSPWNFFSFHLKIFLGPGLFKNCLTRCKFILQTFNSSIIVEAI